MKSSGQALTGSGPGREEKGKGGSLCPGLHPTDLGVL